jgi:hypothetical protein
MESKEHIEIINQMINKTKEQLRPFSLNLIFWGALISIMSIIYFNVLHLFETNIHHILFWTIIPFFGFVFMTNYNIKMGREIGYETHLSRTIKIIWSIFGIAWLFIILLSAIQGFAGGTIQFLILFTSAICLLISGILIKFLPVTLGGASILLILTLSSLIPEISYTYVNLFSLSLGFTIPGLFLYFHKSNE